MSALCDSGPGVTKQRLQVAGGHRTTRVRRGRHTVNVNIGPVDRTIRIVLGVVVLGVGLFVVRGILGAVLDLLGAVLIFSGAVGFCHVRKFLGKCSVAKKA